MSFIAGISSGLRGFSAEPVSQQFETELPGLIERQPDFG